MTDAVLDGVFVLVASARELEAAGLDLRLLRAVEFATESIEHLSSHGVDATERGEKSPQPARSFWIASLQTESVLSAREIEEVLLAISQLSPEEMAAVVEKLFASYETEKRDLAG